MINFGFDLLSHYFKMQKWYGIQPFFKRVHDLYLLFSRTLFKFILLVRSPKFLDISKNIFMYDSTNLIKFFFASFLLEYISTHLFKIEIFNLSLYLYNMRYMPKNVIHINLCDIYLTFKASMIPQHQQKYTILNYIYKVYNMR